MSHAQLLPVSFHGDTIFCIDYQNQPYTPMRPIVENMGLDWGGQAVKLKANKDRWTVEMISTVAQDGVEREMLSMPVRKLPAWLNSINPKKVRPELRPKIELYQQECDDALWAYWTEGQAVRKQPASLPTQSPLSTADDRKPLRALVHAWAQVAGVHHAALWPQVKAHFQLSRIDDLPAEWIPDALAFVQGKIDELAKGKALPLPEMSENDIVVDDATSRRLKRVLRDLHAMQEQCGGLIDEVRICLSPKGRKFFLPEKLDNTYKTLQHLNFAATAGVYMARQALISAYHIGKGIEFC